MLSGAKILLGSSSKSTDYDTGVFMSTEDNKDWERVGGHNSPNGPFQKMTDFCSKPSLTNPSIEECKYRSPKFGNDSQQFKKDSTTDDKSEHHNPPRWYRGPRFQLRLCYAFGFSPLRGFAFCIFLIRSALLRCLRHRVWVDFHSKRFEFVRTQSKCPWR